jgi:hypothetical protein
MESSGELKKMLLFSLHHKPIKQTAGVGIALDSSIFK